MLVTETKSEFLAREKNWLAAITAARQDQYLRVRRMLNEERVAWGLKPVHK
jgi:hypothetical protein